MAEYLKKQVRKFKYYLIGAASVLHYSLPQMRELSSLGHMSDDPTLFKSSYAAVTTMLLYPAQSDSGEHLAQSLLVRICSPTLESKLI